MKKEEQILTTLATLAQGLDNKKTLEEVADAFEAIVEMVREHKLLTEKKIGEIENIGKEKVDAIHEDTKECLEQLTEELTTLFNDNIEIFNTEAEEKFKQLEEKANSIENGKDADEEKIVEVVLSKIPTPEPIKLDTAEDIRNKLETLPDGEKLSISAIEGLEEELKKSKKTTSVINGGIIGRDLVKDIDISSQLDGVTKTFNIQAVWNIISVDLSSFPYGSCRKNVDYTWTPTSITFTDQIDASTQLSAGQSCILTVITG